MYIYKLKAIWTLTHCYNQRNALTTGCALTATYTLRNVTLRLLLMVCLQTLADVNTKHISHDISRDSFMTTRLSLMHVSYILSLFEVEYAFLCSTSWAKAWRLYDLVFALFC